jgi:uncharacterized protein (DUF1501 family)
MIDRRAFLSGVFGGTALAALGGAWPAFAATASPTEYFVLLHAAGGWDVTLWSDPRAEKTGGLDPATTANQATAGLRHWVDAPFDADARVFRPVVAKSAGAEFGPGIGSLLDVIDRVTILNGVAMSTVAHPDGAAFAATGRHLVGGRPVASSLDAVLGDAFGTAEMLPVVSIQFPSAYLAGRLDPRAIPIGVADVGALSRALLRRDYVTSPADRAEVATLLHAEADRAAARDTYPQRMQAIASQYDALARLSKEGVEALVGTAGLRKAQPQLPWTARFASSACPSAAFAIEAIRRNLTRVVSFSMPGFDTHAVNYRFHALTLQDLFEVVVSMMKAFDATPHPTLAGHKLSDHVHMLVFSEFCRTPRINPNGGRDHYPNNSMLLVSPRIRAGRVLGRTDPGELLPVATRRFATGARAVTPPDVLATFLRAVGVDPAPHVRDGEVMTELLAT